MSDPVLEALAARAGSAKPPPSGDPVMDALSQRAAGKTLGETKSKPSWWQTKGLTPVLNDLGETAAHVATGAVGGLGGGLSYLGTLAATGGDTGAAKAVQEDVSDTLTYQPRGPNAQRMAAQVGQVGEWLGPKEGEIGGDVTMDATGSPLLSAAVNTGINALPMLLGARKGGRVVRPGEATAAPIAGEAMDAAANPYARESMGAAAASPDLAATSPELRSAITKAGKEGGLSREVVGRHIEADSLPVKMRLTEGQATQDPTLLSREVNARGKNPRLAQLFTEQNQQLIDNLDEIRATAAPNAVGNDHIQNGQALVDSYKTMDEPITADIRAKYKALEDANGGQFPLNGKDFVSAADKALAKKMKGRYVPAEVAGDLADLRDGGPMTFETFENLRTNLAAESRKAERSGDGNAAMAINIVREELESLPMTGEAAKIKPLADAARSASKARFDRMRADPAYKAAADDPAPIGELSTLADDFIQKHVIKGKAANIKAMRENLSGDPHAGETIAAGALNYVKSKSGVNLYTNEGNFSQAGYNRALGEIQPKLDFLVDPAIAEQARTLGNVARYTQAQPRGSFVNNSNTFVAAAGEHLANAAEGMANVAAHGIPVGTFARKKMAARAERKFVEKATAPAAGVKVKDLLSEKKRPK